MAFGLTTYNNSGELTLSADGITYGYLGLASLVSIAQATGNSTVKTFGRSTYTITWAGDILIALPAKTNGTTALIFASQSGSTWTITVHKGNGSFDAYGFDIQESTEVYVFGAPTSVSGFGLALYDASGNVCADVAKVPLTYKSRINIAENILNWPMPGGTAVPAIIGTPSDYNVTSVSSSAFYINKYSARAWQLNNISGDINRNLFLQHWAHDDGPDASANTIRQINAILIDASGLS